MHRYRHFDDELDSQNPTSPAILPEIEIDDPFQLEFSPRLQDYSPNSNKFKYFFSRRTRLELYLFLLIFLLLIFLFILTIISLHYPKSNSINSICLTPSCIQVSYALSSGMNQSVDPCEDFHEFVCGRWIKNNIIPKGYSAWSITKELTQKNMIILKSILEQTLISLLFKAEQEAIKYYQSCMNITELERLQIQPLEEFFQDHLHFTLKKWIDLDKNQTWQELFVNLTKTISTKYDFSYILPIGINSDEKNSTWNNIHVSLLNERISSIRIYFIYLKD